MTSQELVQQRNDLVEFINSDRMTAQIEAALPENRSSRSYVRALLTGLLDKGDEILAAYSENPAGFALAILRAAQMDLVPDGREGVLNVYRGKNGVTVQFLPMIYGVRKILAEYGWSLRTAVIYENDVFQYDQGEAQVTHHPPRPGVDRGKPEGAYALAVHRDGRRELEVYSAAQIQEVREKSSRNQAIWQQWPDRMWEKTPAHRLAKKLPLAEADRQRLDLLLDENGNGDALVDSIYGSQRDTPSPHGVVPSTGKASPSNVEAGETEPLSQAESVSPDPAAPDEPEFHEPSDEELAAAAAGQTSLTDEPVVFDRGKFEGETIEQVYASGPAGRSYLEWAVREWSWPSPSRAALDAFADEHPELKTKGKK